jgi:hypothetical protein
MIIICNKKIQEFLGRRNNRREFFVSALNEVRTTFIKLWEVHPDIAAGMPIFSPMLLFPKEEMN